MINYISIFILVLVLQFTMSSIFAQEDAHTQIYDSLQYKTFKAEFSQKVLDDKKRLIEEAYGVFFIQRPGRFRWEYKYPNKQIIVSDGTRVVSYDADLEQATVQSMESVLSYVLITLLLQNDPAFENFQVFTGEPAEGLNWIILIPKAQDTTFTKIKLGMNDKKIMKIKMYDNFELQTIIEFSKSAYNATFSKDTFRLFLPEGTDIIGEYDLSSP